VVLATSMPIRGALAFLRATVLWRLTDAARSMGQLFRATRKYSPAIPPHQTSCEEHEPDFADLLSRATLHMNPPSVFRHAIDAPKLQSIRACQLSLRR